MAFDGVSEEADGRRTDLLLKLADTLDNLTQRQYSHGTWLSHDKECGTVACALGWAAETLTEETGLTHDGMCFVLNGERYEWPYSAAQKVFNITHDEAQALFGAGHPAQLFYQLHEPKHATAAYVAERIRAFVYDRSLVSVTA